MNIKFWLFGNSAWLAISASYCLGQVLLNILGYHLYQDKPNPPDSGRGQIVLAIVDSHILIKHIKKP